VKISFLLLGTVLATQSQSLEVSMSFQLESMPQQSLPAPAYVLGVRVDRLSQQQTLDMIEQIIVSRRASGNTLPCQQIITVNTEFVMAAQQNAEFRHTINTAALVIADGIGVVWATHYVDSPAPERITGTDTLVALTKRCAQKGHRLYLLGAAPGVAEQAAERLQALAPGLEIAGTYAGSPTPAEEDAILERIHAANADVLCVAYGAPAQDLWIHRNLSRLSVAVAMGVGGAYDFLSGRQCRAPRAMQRMGLEWLYRLYREPWRWQRMLAIPHFMLQVLLRGRKKYDP
jgi:N-acetylglucosaminyldiphosphoundecaprenol N-acetyl-beta-D-mannosaminyltransferase